eukprot:1139398-Pelagomonas_calceolata.AAC.3
MSPIKGGGSGGSRFLSSKTADRHPLNANCVKGGGLCAWLGLNAMRSRVWPAGGVEVNMRQTNPNFQDIDIV